MQVAALVKHEFALCCKRSGALIFVFHPSRPTHAKALRAPAHACMEVPSHDHIARGRRVPERGSQRDSWDKVNSHPSKARGAPKTSTWQCPKAENGQMPKTAEHRATTPRMGQSNAATIDEDKQCQHEKGVTHQPRRIAIADVQQYLDKDRWRPGGEERQRARC